MIQRYKNESDTIQTNCNNWFFLTGRELQLLEEISSLCGKTIEDNPQPILSVSDLQRLDKDAGEALLLCGRAKPCITRLADIEIYDNNQVERVPVSRRPPQSPPKLKIKLSKDMKKIASNFHRNPSLIPQSLTDLEIEQMIENIGRKFAEFDEEEKQMKTETGKRNKDIKESKQK